MNCPRCQHENPRASRFCGACGSSLMQSVTCLRCGHSNPAGQAFCNGCGQGLGEAAAPSARDPRTHTPQHLAAKILQSKAALEGERKQVTVLFADVKGSVELAEQLDPEVFHRAAHLALGRVLVRSEGVHAREAVESALALASSLVSETGAARYAPFITSNGPSWRGASVRTPPASAS